MAHIHSSNTRAEATAREWLPLGAQLGELVNIWADRTDLIAYVGPGAGGIAPACYNPKLAEVEVNVDVAFGTATTPGMIGDLRRRATQFEYPKATGAIYHEALHAKYSRWSLEDAMRELSDKEFQAITLLEETRIEANGVNDSPKNQVFLRACALEIVLADAEEGLKGLTSTRAAAHVAGLTLARVDAGVLRRGDIEVIADSLEAMLPEEVLTKLRSIWNRFQMHDEHYNSAPLYDLAREWVATVEEAAKDDAQSESDDADGSTRDFVKDLLDALVDDAETVSVAVSDQAADQAEGEEWAEIASGKARASREKHENAKTAQNVFSKGTGPMAGVRSNSRLREKRQPSSAERVAAVKVATMLEKAKYRERDMHEISSIVPPGRLRTRALVQGAALKSKGIVTQTEPWRRNVRKHTDEPTLSIGVMVDISGSMGSAMEPMAATAWVMSEASRRVQGRAAMVYYGSDVFPTLKPGQSLDKVHIYTAPDATEQFDKAFKAIDGALSLLHSDGARLLVVVSDAFYTVEETAKATKWIKRCHAEGVAVLWLPFDSGTAARRICRDTDAVILDGLLNPADAATKIGQAAAAALTKVSARATA
jgi:hypothetical protein